MTPFFCFYMYFGVSVYIFLSLILCLCPFVTFTVPQSTSQRLYQCALPMCHYCIPYPLRLPVSTVFCFFSHPGCLNNCVTTRLPVCVPKHLCPRGYLCLFCGVSVRPLSICLCRQPSMPLSLCHAYVNTAYMFRYSTQVLYIFWFP